MVSDYDGFLLSFYIDGVLTDEMETDAMVNPSETIKALYIGVRDDSRVGYSGSIDRIRFSNTTLTLDQFDKPQEPVSVESWMLYGG